MTDLTPLLVRIADALDRLAPIPTPVPDLAACRSFRWDGVHLAAVSPAPPLPLDRFVGVAMQMAALQQNLAAHANGVEAHDILLWGARGSGKSALVRAISHCAGLALVEAGADTLPSLPALFACLETRANRFLVFVDDLAFEASDPAIRTLRSLLDGGVAARPANTRVAVTSNHRHLVAREMAENEAAGAVNPRDVLDDRLALADRFGLKLGFQYPDQAAFLEMVAAYAAHFGLDWDEADALAFAHQRGGRSGRVAWHYAVELAGQAGRSL